MKKNNDIHKKYNKMWTENQKKKKTKSKNKKQKKK